MDDQPNYDPKKWVAYYSAPVGDTAAIDAQREEVTAAAQAAGATIIAEYQEQGRGLYDYNSPLRKAISDTEGYRAVLVVAKHDRLSRDLSFVANLIFNQKVPVKMLNLPDEATTDPLLFGAFVGMAERGITEDDIERWEQDRDAALADMGVIAAGALDGQQVDKAMLRRMFEAIFAESNVLKSERIILKLIIAWGHKSHGAARATIRKAVKAGIICKADTTRHAPYKLIKKSHETNN